MKNCGKHQAGPGAPAGPPHYVDLHVNAGECVSLQLLDGQEQVVAGPATITMVSQQQNPPIPIPVQVPPGHMIHQIADENGTLKHIILSVMDLGDDNAQFDFTVITLPQGTFRIDSNGDLVSTGNGDNEGATSLTTLPQQAYFANYNGFMPTQDVTPTLPDLIEATVVPAPDGQVRSQEVQLDRDLQQHQHGHNKSNKSSAGKQVEVNNSKQRRSNSKTSSNSTEISSLSNESTSPKEALNGSSEPQQALAQPTLPPAATAPVPPSPPRATSTSVPTTTLPATATATSTSTINTDTSMATENAAQATPIATSASIAPTTSSDINPTSSSIANDIGTLSTPLAVAAPIMQPVDGQLYSYPVCCCCCYCDPQEALAGVPTSALPSQMDLGLLAPEQAPGSSSSRISSRGSASSLSHSNGVVAYNPTGHLMTPMAMAPMAPPANSTLAPMGGSNGLLVHEMGKRKGARGSSSGSGGQINGYKQHKTPSGDRQKAYQSHYNNNNNHHHQQAYSSIVSGQSAGGHTKASQTSAQYQQHQPNTMLGGGYSPAYTHPYNHVPAGRVASPGRTSQHQSQGGYGRADCDSYVARGPRDQHGYSSHGPSRQPPQHQQQHQHHQTQHHQHQVDHKRPTVGPADKSNPARYAPAPARQPKVLNQHQISNHNNNNGSLSPIRGMKSKSSPPYPPNGVRHNCQDSQTPRDPRAQSTAVTQQQTPPISSRLTRSPSTPQAQKASSNPTHNLSASAAPFHYQAPQRGAWQSGSPARATAQMATSEQAPITTNGLLPETTGSLTDQSERVEEAESQRGKQKKTQGQNVKHHRDAHSNDSQQPSQGQEKSLNIVQRTGETSETKSSPRAGTPKGSPEWQAAAGSPAKSAQRRSERSEKHLKSVETGDRRNVKADRATDRSGSPAVGKSSSTVGEQSLDKPVAFESSEFTASEQLPKAKESQQIQQAKSQKGKAKSASNSPQTVKTEVTARVASKSGSKTANGDQIASELDHRLQRELEDDALLVVARSGSPSSGDKSNSVVDVSMRSNLTQDSVTQPNGSLAISSAKSTQTTPQKLLQVVGHPSSDTNGNSSGNSSSGSSKVIPGDSSSSRRKADKRRGSRAVEAPVKLRQLNQLKLINLSCSSVTSGSVQLRWSYMPQAVDKYGLQNYSPKLTALLADHFVVESSTSGKNVELNTLPAPKIVYQGCAFACRVNHLSPEKVYHFRVRRTALLSTTLAVGNKQTSAHQLADELAASDTGSATSEHVVVSDILSVTLPGQSASSKKASRSLVADNSSSTSSSSGSSSSEPASSPGIQHHGHNSSSHSNSSNSYHNSSGSTKVTGQPVKFSNLIRQCRTRMVGMLSKLVRRSLSSCSDAKFAGFVLVLFTVFAMLLAFLIHLYIVIPVAE